MKKYFFEIYFPDSMNKDYKIYYSDNKGNIIKSIVTRDTNDETYTELIGKLNKYKHEKKAKFLRGIEGCLGMVYEVVDREE
jgi:hypothetical protein